MIRALVLPVVAETGAFVEALRHARVPVRSFEEQGQIILEVPDDRTASLVQQLHADWRRGERSWAKGLKPTPEGINWRALVVGVLHYPGVAVVLLITFAVYPWVVSLAAGELNALSALMLIVNVEDGNTVTLTRLAQDFEPWRWLTPVFIHFSFMHIAFNAAVIFEFGRRIEVAQGSFIFILLVIITGVLSNIVQVLTGLGPLFGGLSGVGYALLGYILVRQKFDPQNRAWAMHPSVALSMLVFLVLFSSGITESFGMQVANGAHWGGLVSGALLSLLAGAPKMRPS
jgi:GlpG protein